MPRPRLSAGLRPSIVTSQIASCASTPISVRGCRVVEGCGELFVVPLRQLAAVEHQLPRAANRVRRPRPFLG
ncbi:MAG: hypothetical protein H0W18_09600 [Acidobacteria bacterium]|nr:hypothetical protein [Acidobacteriota bacterium]